MEREANYVAVGTFMLVVLAVVFYGLRTIAAARRDNKPSVKETPYVPAPAAASVAEVQ